MSSTAEYLDHYCERLEPGLWAEPFNALTNLAFLAAAWWLGHRYLKRFPSSSDRHLSHYWLIFLIVCIGFGSGLFHTFATPWAEWVDVIPILMFQLSFLWVYLRQIAGAGYVSSSFMVVLFIALNLMMGMSSNSLAELTNGSFMYLPAILAIGWIGMDYQNRYQQSGWLILAAASLFCLSLTFRALDKNICQFLPIGTHFVWHLMNAVVLSLCAWSVLRQPALEKPYSSNSTPVPTSRVNL